MLRCSQSGCKLKKAEALGMRRDLLKENVHDVYTFKSHGEPGVNKSCHMVVSVPDQYEEYHQILLIPIHQSDLLKSYRTLRKSHRTQYMFSANPTEFMELSSLSYSVRM
jgi:hypothetical protein